MEPCPTVRRRTGSVLLTSAVAFVAISACSSGPPDSGPSSVGAVLPVGPSVSVPTSTEATGTPSAGSATPAPLPAAAHTRTIGGAETFVRHFVAEYNRAGTTPATGLLRPLSTSSCVACAELEESVDALVRDRERLAHASMRVHSTAVRFSRSSDPVWVVTADMSLRRVAILDAQNAKVQEFPAASGEWEFQLLWSSGWHVSKISGTQ